MSHVTTMQSVDATEQAERPTTVQPASLSELIAHVRNAVETHRAIAPIGGGTGMDYGYPLRTEAPLSLDMTAMNRITALEPGDLTITVEAGTTLATIQEALLPHRLFLPLDPPHGDRATIGGILATNAFGPSRIGYGTARDWLIGLTVVDGQGRAVNGGGKVVKNVTGYDIPKLHIGALGTLGIIAEATFKVAPLPEAVRTVIITRGISAEDDAFVRRILDTTSPTQAYLRSDSNGRYILFVYTGFEEVVDQEVARVQAAIGEGERVTVIPEQLEREDTLVSQLAVRLIGQLSDDFARHEALTTLTLASGATIETLIGCGISEAAWPEVTEVALTSARYVAQTLVQPKGLAVASSFPHAPLSLRQEDISLWSPEPASLPLLRRLKTNLDPHLLLNPGRYVGRL